MQPSLLELETAAGKLALNQDGTIRDLAFREGGGWNRVLFRADDFRGPGWFVDPDGVEQRVPLRPIAGQPGVFRGEAGQLRFRLEYHFSADSLCLQGSVQNGASTAFAPRRCGIKLGLDTYMIHAPDWDALYFPTLLRCEKSHFWGYCMSPLGRILGLASPDPVASWSMDYNFTMYGPHRHEGHRIYTFNLDLINSLPLPDRHPQNLSRLLPGERKTWTLYLVPLAELEQVAPALAELCSAPMISCERHTLAPGETARVRVFSPTQPSLLLTRPDGSTATLEASKPDPSGARQVSFGPVEEAGVYTLTAGDGLGKHSEAKLYVRRPWSWYLKQARSEALNKPQKASTHVEGWMGFFSAFLARRHFPEPGLDQPAEAQFRECLGLMYNLETAQPVIEPGRIQNTAAMIGLLADVYEAGARLADLELAARLADWLIQSQGPDGAYRAFSGAGSHYTSVTYMAKYMLELASVEKRLGQEDPIWQARYERHFHSAQLAIEDLERLRDQIGTEGEHTFEDGMISCTAAQLAQFALLQEDPDQRSKYTRAARQVLDKHACLEQRLIPDCRMTGATLRFWEAQYDVLIKHNMFNSPHGWTSWKTYATWYLYLLSGEEELLRQTMDTLGACVQSLDLAGNLRWAFAVDPWIPARVFKQHPANPDQGVYEETVLGEQYVEMISGWWKTPSGVSTGGYWGQGGCCDNDVHEHFKCLEEVALTSAYVVERADGQLAGWNCRVEISAGAITVDPLEEVVSSVHLNLKQPAKGTVRFHGHSTPFESPVNGMFWVRK